VIFQAIPELALPGRVRFAKPYSESKQRDIVYTVGIILDRQDPRLRWKMTAKVSIASQEGLLYERRTTRFQLSLAATAAGLIFGVLAALLPARQGARMEIIRARRYE
jgi:hypothetical protein